MVTDIRRGYPSKSGDYPQRARDSLAGFKSSMAWRYLQIGPTLPPPALIENSVAVGASTVSILNTLDRTLARPSGAAVHVINGVVWCAWRRRDGRTSNLWRVANATAHFTAMDPGYCFQPSHPLNSHPHPPVSVYVSADAFV
ncbi:hypothetical protein TNIN_13291 [Trichonephila inaurata madagascariensis]|uniref:Uncharacterized protein n=1 Tax=Trichonephila inaurata madagascariensis TaxID=2747483 RepID=A0A8X7CKI8_9ARAC|nr:hypothetical protein TNIN_13291 [Trichonephila inaurata madagascariensis]